MPENKMDSRLSRLEVLNKTLNPTHDLSGVFLPVGSSKQFGVMFLAEMPSMNVPKDWVEGQPIPNFAETARDKFLQEMMIKYGVAGSYVTDIVKTRDVPRSPEPDEVTRWLPFLLTEIEIIQPQTLVVLGRRTYEASFRPFVAGHIPTNVKVDWVFHYSNQVPRKKFEDRFRQVVGNIKRAHPGRPNC
jgi:uracil-DNA glycosylase family 4